MLGIKLAILNHWWSTIGYEMFLNVIGRSLLCDAYISSQHIMRMLVPSDLAVVLLYLLFV